MLSLDRKNLLEHFCGDQIIGVSSRDSFQQIWWPETMQFDGVLLFTQELIDIHHYAMLQIFILRHPMK